MCVDSLPSIGLDYTCTGADAGFIRGGSNVLGLHAKGGGGAAWGPMLKGGGGSSSTPQDPLDLLLLYCIVNLDTLPFKGVCIKEALYLSRASPSVSYCGLP